MKAYWESSALVEAWVDPGVRARLKREGGITRTHSLAETFSTITGGRLGVRVESEAAAQIIAQLAEDLEFCDLGVAEVLRALKQAKSRGVRGGHVHDYLHAVAASKAGARELLTLDKNDFKGLVTGLAVQQV